jgi:hypothetical protein
MKEKLTIKKIEVFEDGELIDCYYNINHEGLWHVKLGVKAFKLLSVEIKKYEDN